jgi:DNA repair exonuclease SbcCD nuclease subunit
MVRFLHVSDVHLGFEQYGTYERFKDFGRALNHSFDMAIEQKVDLIIIGGDLFNKKNIKASTLLQADAILTKAKNAGIPVYACEGNHDSLSYGTNWSWLNYLARKDLLILLGLPTQDRIGKGGSSEQGTGRVDPLESGQENVLLPSWDPELREGSHIERTFNGERVRIYGFGYLGATTRKRIEEMADHIIRDEATNIGILHAGVEGVIANMHGTIPEHALAPLRDRLDYLALGHIHKRFTVEDWVFNPGSLENCSLEEASPKNPHGLYLVELRRKGLDSKNLDEDLSPHGIEHQGHADAKFVDGTIWRRPFSVIFVDVTGVDSPESIMERAIAKVSDSLGITGAGQRNGIPESVEKTYAERISVPDVREAGCRGFGTLDAYVPDVRVEKQSNSPLQKDHQEKEENRSIVDDDGMVRDQGKEGLPPIVIVRLRGDIRLKEKIDTGVIKDRIEGMIHPGPLHLEVRDETGSEGFTVEDETPSSREDFERQVIMELLGQGEFQEQAGDINTLMADFMRAVVSNHKEDLNTFDTRVRELAERMTAQ